MVMWRRVLITTAIMWIACAGHVTAQAADLRPFHRGDFSALVSANNGHPLIINFWSITCPPCLAEMPTLKTFSAQYPDVRLELISTDSFDDEARIQLALTRQGFGDRVNWVFAEAHKTRLRFDIDKSWRGELPRTYFVARDGHVHGHSGMLDFADLETWVKQQR